MKTIKVGDTVTTNGGSEVTVISIDSDRVATVKFSDGSIGLRDLGSLLWLRSEDEGSSPSSISAHEGKKYLRTIYPASDCPGEPIQIDTYEVTEAYGITCAAQIHALKKILVPGQRGKGDRIADLRGAIAALNRAIELEERRSKQGVTA